MKDSSGAVLPGVTVEASSPALIEKVRSVVTDESGQYKIVALRPGIYAVSFALPNFATVKREGIELTVNFTATVNADMRVGDIAETVTVPGETPVVDVQNVLQQTVMTREVLDALPTARNIQAVAIPTPGVTISRPDVGGSEGMQLTYNTVHGSNTRDMALQIDGMGVTSSLADGQNFAVYHNDGEYEEVTFQTSGISAEVGSGGIRVNMIPREGGNVFKGSVFAAYAPGSLQSDNFSADLPKRGLTAGPHIDKIWDYNVSLGGPIKKDKLWFFTSLRYWGVNQRAPNSFDENGKQGIDDSLLKSYALRLTTKVAQSNKLTVAYDRLPKWRGHREIAAGIDPKATVVQTTPWAYTTQAKWTSTVGSRLLIENGFSRIGYNYWLKYRPEVAMPSATNPYGDIAHVDLITGTRKNAALQQFNNWFTMNRIVSSVMYVTGSHAFKTGVEYGFGPNENVSTVNGDLIQRYRNGVPNSVQIANTPVHQLTRINADMGVYAQDVWTVKRATFNLGLRYGYFNGSVEAQTAAAGRFVPQRSFAAIPNLPNWKDLSPRLGFAYDVFGDSKTALKVSVSKYMQNEATGFAGIYNPMGSSSDIRTWNDLNGNDIAEINELGPSQNTSFGVAPPRRSDPNLKRSYQMEYVVNLQRQIVPRLSVTGGYFRRGFYRLVHSVNLATTPSDFSAVNIVNPSNGETFPIYNLNPSKLGLVDILDSNSATNTRTYNGYEASVNGRYGKGLVIAGVTIGRTRAVTCDIQDDPNLLRYCDQRQFDIPFTAQYKLSGSRLLPFGIQASGVLQSYPGDARNSSRDGSLPLVNPSLNVNYIVDRTVVPTLIQSTLTVPLLPPGSKYLDRLTQLDARLGKVVKVRGFQVEGMLDFFNVLNSNVVFTQIQTYGAALDRPTDIMQGRVIRVGAQLKF